MRSKIQGVYAIKNVITGEMYIGASSDAKHRWMYHRRDLRRGTHGCRKLQLSWIKYGEGAFVWEIMEYVPKTSKVVEREQWWMDFYDITHTGFNSRLLADKNLGLKHPYKPRSTKGEPKSPEHRLAISVANKGRRFSPEHIAALKVAMKGKNKGVKFSSERKAAISAGLKRHNRTPEHQAALNAARWPQ